MINDKKYFYLINYNSIFEETLCNMEMKCLFNKKHTDKYLFSEIYINPSRSPFIKEMISIRYVADTLEDIIKRIEEDNLMYNQFKVLYVKLEHNEIEYEERLNAVKRIGVAIKGQSNMHEPDFIFGVTKVEGKWIFGEYGKNDFLWHVHDHKPYSYSNSLNVRLARALVNIAVGNNLDIKLIDPCCGVGTVVIEALSMGIDIRGCELNPSIALNAQKNLKFYGYDNVITSGDMNNITETYDVAIVDMPYGLFTPTTFEAQEAIIKTTRRIAKKAIIVTFEDMDNSIINAGFEIVDKCHFSKGKFTRYINICR